MNEKPVNNEQVWLYGVSGHALVILDTLNDLGVTVLGCFDDAPNRSPDSSLKLHPGIKLAAGEFSRPPEAMLISIGSSKVRKMLANQLNGPFATVVHPSAIVSNTAEIGQGTVVFHSAVIQTRSKIGRHVIINTGASVDHENVIEDYVSVSPRATLCGNVHVGEGAFIGCGANIIQGIRIGKWATIGAGAVVIQDVPDYALVVGNPGRIVRTEPPTHQM